MGEHTVVEIFVIISFVIGFATVIDIFRRPSHEWAHVDRNRGYWGFLSILLGIFGVRILCRRRLCNIGIAALWIIQDDPRRRL